MGNDISLIIAFSAGLVSFLSPCVLPIIPGFLAYLAGSSTTNEGTKRMGIFMNSLFFVLGFATIFSILGILLNTLLEAVAYDVQIWLARIGGSIVIFFGLYLTGIIKIAFFDRAHKFSIKRKFGSTYATSFLFGSAFAAGWTPCVGAALGAILGLAATEPGSAFNLLFAYSLGLGVPFLIVGLFTARASSIINRYAHLVSYINKAFGVILIILGILVFTQTINRIANFELLNSVLLK